MEIRNEGTVNTKSWDKIEKLFFDINPVGIEHGKTAV